MTNHCNLASGPKYGAHHTGQYYQHTTADSTKGYWKVHTDYNTRTTHVSFYTTEHELLYQEKIKDRYVKLTKRTVRQFDNLLNRLVKRNLVADRIKSYDLMASNERMPTYLSDRTMPGEEPDIAITITSASTLPETTLDVVSNTQLKLSFLNPTQERLLITIADDSYRYMYKDQSTLRSYHRLLNVGRLVSGRYRLDIDGAQKLIRYDLLIDQERKRLVVMPGSSRFKR